MRGLVAMLLIVVMGGCSTTNQVSPSSTASATSSRTPTPTAVTSTPLAAATRSTWAVACGTVSGYEGNTSTAYGTMVLDSPGRSPLKIALTQGFFGSASGNVCVSLVARVPAPIFDGFFPPNTPGFIPEGTLPATKADPAPTGFVVPQACAYVVPPVVGGDQTSWKVDCGAEANRNARGTLAPAFTQQGWTSCGAVTATERWVKPPVMIVVVESSLSPCDYPRFDQLARPATGCQ